MNTVLVLMGGPDAEREVSLDSGAAVAEALRQSGRFGVSEVVIDRPNIAELRETASGVSAEVIFPVLHGHWGEGGPLQELLEELGLPYVGCRPQPAARAMDKLVSKMLIGPEGVATPPSRQLTPDDECDLDPPLVLKPVDDGSSVDMRICHTVDQVEQGRRELHPSRGRLMAERFIGGREITVGILGTEALPLIEIIPADEAGFYDYAAKYEREDTRYVVRPDLPAEVARTCRDWALIAFNRLGCRDLARVDFMVDDAGPWFLEINTMPGFTSHSLVPMAARKIGLEMPDLCAKLADIALNRPARPIPTIHTTPR